MGREPFVSDVGAADLTVAAAMIRRPKVCGPVTSMADVREMFEDDHVHAVLVADGHTLLTVVERSDLRGTQRDAPARESGRLDGRTTGPDADLAETWRWMSAEPRRRLAVVDNRHTLLGLLCLKRSSRGFCSDDDVAARATELERALPPAVVGEVLVGGRGA